MNNLAASLTHFDYSRKLLESILNVGNDYICVKDREGRFVYINDKDASLYNAKPQDLLGNTTEPFVGRGQFEEWFDDDIAVLDSGERKHYEVYSRQGKDGRIYWFDTVKIPFTDEHTRQDLLLIVHRDVTAIKEAEIERDLLREQMLVAQKMETIGLLSASVAHDFNNMLTIIMASANLLTAKENLDAEAHFLGDSITKSAGRAADIVSRLLILSRRENVEYGSLDLRKYLQETQSMLHAVLGEKIHLIFDLGFDPLPIHGNGSMIEQSVINLILNARDALPRGGSIWVKGSIIHESGGDCVALEIRDNGTGMSPEIQKRIFDPFYTTKPVGQGSGLGLVVVQRIMEQHQGRIEMESRIHEGTRFILKFPKSIEETPAPVIPEVLPNTQLAGKTVLLVEDEEMVRELISISLDALGVKTILARSGDEAWRIFTQSGRPIDCVLTDVVMEGELDGVSLRKKISAQRPHLPVILMTGYSFNYFQGHEALPGNTDILHKPFVMEALREKLLKLLAV